VRGRKRSRFVDGRITVFVLVPGGTSTFREFSKRRNDVQSREKVRTKPQKTYWLLGSMMRCGLLVDFLQVHPFENFLLNDEIVALSLGELEQESRSSAIP
jgi:hypothetical protein